MNDDSDRRHLSWYVSALLYRLSYIQLAHQLDDDLFRYLGEQVSGSVVADCGCGPGVGVETFLEHGAAQVFAIDSNLR
jgi:ubiquinone/menaquinone biosynthesis C-methylase UbiE